MVLWEDKQNGKTISQTHQEKEKIQLNKIRNEKVEVKTKHTEIQNIIRDYYEQPYPNKMDNLEEMDKFLEKYNLPKLNEEEIENMNRPITSATTESILRTGEVLKYITWRVMKPDNFGGNVIWYNH